jgi:hypothetical protein
MGGSWVSVQQFNIDSPSQVFSSPKVVLATAALRLAMALVEKDCITFPILLQEDYDVVLFFFWFLHVTFPAVIKYQ